MDWLRLCKRIILKIYGIIRGRVWYVVHCNKMNFDKAGYNLYYTKDKRIHVDGKGLNLNIGLWTNVSTAKEVFCRQDYHFYTSETYVMFDIGFNLGMTSLYCAQNEQIKKIYAFEPFRPTRVQGEENLKNNPELAKKIEVFDYGLGEENKEIEIHYNPDSTRGMSTVSDIFSGKKKLALEKAQVKNVSSVLKPLFEKHPEKKFVKVDCEGAEYEIIPDLDKSGLLKEIDVLILEWHRRYGEKPTYFIDILGRNGYNLHCEHASPDTQGMIYAFKK